MCSTTLWARNVSSRWLGCARGTALSTAFALPANWTRMAPTSKPPGRRLRRVTSAPTTLATSARTSAGSSSGWVPEWSGTDDDVQEGRRHGNSCGGLGSEHQAQRRRPPWVDRDRGVNEDRV